MPSIQPRLGITELESLLDDSLEVRHIAEPFESCSDDEDAEAVKKRMVEKNFDHLGLTVNGQLAGYVRRDDLNGGHCLQYKKDFRADEIIANRTSLIELLPLLKEKPTFFVLRRARIDGIVNRADLHKWPARMLLFSLVSTLEVYLLQMVRESYPGGTFLPSLKDGRAQMAKHLFDERRKRDEDVDLADCLQIADKVELLLKLNGWAASFGVPGPGKDKSRKHFRDIAGLRDKLAHAQDLTLGISWQEVITVALSVEFFLKRCEQAWREFVLKFGRKTESTPCVSESAIAGLDGL